MSHWIQTTDGDPLAAALYRRHYSCRQYQDGRRDDPTNRNRNLFVGPGEKMVLVTSDYKALFVWRKFIDKSGQFGVNCAVFRNESRTLASELIKDACAWAWQRWPGQRLYTYVDASAIQSTNPGYCFRRAGWQRCGISKKRKLIILELYPEEVILSTLTRRNPLAAQTDITLATETNAPGSPITELLPSEIRIDAGLQTRDKVNQEKIAEYAEAMVSGDQFPPLLVYRIGTEPGYLLVKGFHRFNAHIAAFDRKPIRCKITHGSRREALKEALADNADHGLPLNREDKRKKVKIALADEEWGQWSDREIAKLCKVSHPLVAEVRREVTGNSSSDQPRTYNTRHGTQATMNTERIRQANSARQAPAKTMYVADQLATNTDAAPRPLTVDETLAVILRFIERGCNSAAPGLQLDFLRRNTEPRAYLPAVNPGRTLDSKCFREAWRQAEVLLGAEVKKATRSETIIQRVEAEYDTANPLAPPARSDRIQALRKLCQSLIDSLPDYGELTGDYSGTLPLRRALEPMIRKLEENLIG